MLGALYVISSSNHKLQGRIIHILEGRKPGTEKLSDLLTQTVHGKTDIESWVSLSPKSPLFPALARYSQLTRRSLPLLLRLTALCSGFII